MWHPWTPYETKFSISQTEIYMAMFKNDGFREFKLFYPIFLKRIKFYVESWLELNQKTLFGVVMHVGLL